MRRAAYHVVTMRDIADDATGGVKDVAADLDAGAQDIPADVDGAIAEGAHAQSHNRARGNGLGWGDANNGRQRDHRWPGIGPGCGSARQPIHRVIAVIRRAAALASSASAT